MTKLMILSYFRFSIYKDAVDFLLTEDKGIHKKAEILGVAERIFLIEEALEFFSKLLPKHRISAPPAIKFIPTYNLNLEDSIFNSLKEDYHEIIHNYN